MHDGASYCDVIRSVNVFTVICARMTSSTGVYVELLLLREFSLFQSRLACNKFMTSLEQAYVSAKDRGHVGERGSTRCTLQSGPVRIDEPTSD